MRVARKRFSVSIALLASLLLSSITLTAQTTNSDWSRLSAVESGSKLVVKLKDGNTVKGKLSGVSDTALSLSIKDKAVELRREEVFSVHQVVGTSAKKATLIGLGVGAGAGALVGKAGSSNDNGFNFEKLDHAVTAGLAVLGAGAGAGIGYLVGRSSSKRVLIYQANQP